MHALCESGTRRNDDRVRCEANVSGSDQAARLLALSADRAVRLHRANYDVGNPFASIPAIR